MTDTPAKTDSPQPAPGAKKIRGTIQVVQSRCKGCGFCIEFCPQKVLAFSEDYNTSGYRYPQLLKDEGCTGCDLCGLYCPDFAIHGVILKAAAKAAPAKSSEEGVR